MVTYSLCASWTNELMHQAAFFPLDSLEWKWKEDLQEATVNKRQGGKMVERQRFLSTGPRSLSEHAESALCSESKTARPSGVGREGPWGTGIFVLGGRGRRVELSGESALTAHTLRSSWHHASSSWPCSRPLELFQDTLCPWSSTWPGSKTGSSVLRSMTSNKADVISSTW